MADKLSEFLAAQNNQAFSQHEEALRKEYGTLEVLQTCEVDDLVELGMNKVLARSLCAALLQIDAPVPQAYTPGFECTSAIIGGEVVSGQMSLLTSAEFFRIPFFQRNYAWQVDLERRGKFGQIERMLSDFATTYGKTLQPSPDAVNFEYLGNIIVWKKGNKSQTQENWLLDGQQRLTTLVIFWAVARYVCNEKAKCSAVLWNRNKDDSGGSPPAEEIAEYFRRKSDGKARLQLRDEDLQTWFEDLFFPPKTQDVNAVVAAHQRFLEFVQMIDQTFETVIGEGTKFERRFKVGKPKETARFDVKDGTPQSRIQLAAILIYRYLSEMGPTELADYLLHISTKVHFTITTVSETPDKYISAVRSFFLRLNDTGLILNDADKVKVELVTSFTNEEKQRSVARQWERIEDCICELAKNYGGGYYSADGRNTAFEDFLLHVMEAQTGEQRNERGFYNYYAAQLQGSASIKDREAKASIIWKDIVDYSLRFILLLDPMETCKELVGSPLKDWEMRTLRVSLMRLRHIRPAAKSSRVEWHSVAMRLMQRYWDTTGSPKSTLIQFILQLERLVVSYALTAQWRSVMPQTRHNVYHATIKRINKDAGLPGVGLNGLSPDDADNPLLLTQQQSIKMKPKAGYYNGAEDEDHDHYSLLDFVRKVSLVPEQDSLINDCQADSIGVGYSATNTNSINGVVRYLLLYDESLMYDYVDNDDELRRLAMVLMIAKPEIEHIRPQTISKGSAWKDTPWVDIFTHSLGNLVMLEGNINSSASNLPFHAPPHPPGAPDSQVEVTREAPKKGKKQKTGMFEYRPTAGKVEHYLGYCQPEVVGLQIQNQGPSNFRSVTYEIAKSKTWTREEFVKRHERIVMSLLAFLTDMKMATLASLKKKINVRRNPPWYQNDRCVASCSRSVDGTTPAYGYTATAARAP